MNNLQILSSIYSRLLAIERYSTMPKNTRESVAAHSYCVSLLCMLFAEKYPKLDGHRMLKMALIHDQEESISGDVMANLKRFHPEVRSALSDASSEFINIMFEGLEYKDQFKRVWLEYKDRETEEAKFVKIADIVSRVFLMRVEYNLGNKTASEILNNSILELSELDTPEWIVDEVNGMLSDIPGIGDAKEFTRW